MSLRWTTPSTRVRAVPPPRPRPAACRPARAIRSTAGVELARARRRPARAPSAAIASRGALPHLHAVGVHAAHPRGRARRERRSWLACAGRRRSACRPRSPNCSLASTTMLRPSGVSSGSDASCARSASSSDAHARQRDELDRLAVAERDRAGLVEQQRVHVARRLDGAAAHRDHVLLDQPVHAGDADGREQAADGRRDEADQERDEDRHRDRRRRCRSRTAAA